MSINLFLQKTSFNSVATWMSSATNSLPITLSSGSGVDNFINIDQPNLAIVQRRTLNYATYSYYKPTNISGTATFHVQSSALASLRSVLTEQEKTGIPISGKLIIISTSALTYTEYNNLIWSSPYQGASINKTYSDVILTFTANAPKTISLGAVSGLATGVLGSGMF